MTVTVCAVWNRYPNMESQCAQNGLIEPNWILGHFPAVYPQDNGALVSMFRDPYARIYSEFTFFNLLCTKLNSGEVPPEAKNIFSAFGLTV